MQTAQDLAGDGAIGGAKGAEAGTVNEAATVRAPSGGTVTKSAFAKILGVSPGRVSQMIGQGLPVEANGRIDVARGRCWYGDNIDGRAKAPADLFQAAGPSAKEERDFHEARLRKLKADQMEGTLVDKAEVERTIFGRARADRDAWLAWTADAAAAIAAELRVDEAALLPVLSRLVRDHLTELSERSDVL